MAAVASAIQEDFASIRQRVLQEHPNLSKSIQLSSASAQLQSDPLALLGKPLRQHELWSRYGPRDLTPTQAQSGAVIAVGAASVYDTVADIEDNEEEHETYTRQAERAFGPAYCADEQTIRPDHSWNYVATDLRELPANAVRSRDLEGRFIEYPRLRRLLEHKRKILQQVSSPATYLAADLKDSLSPPPPPNRVAEKFHLATLMPVKFDVVLIDAPLSCYEWDSVPSSSNVKLDQVWSWEDVSELPISLLAAKESFVFLWVGPGCSDGLERGREALTRWGYRRCEVITWCLTSSDDGSGSGPKWTRATAGDQGGVFTTTAVHCLMGIRGTVRRSKDTNFVHCNIDTDVIFWDGEPSSHPTASSSHEGGTRHPSTDPQAGAAVDLRLKPPELYSVIENFCLGTRRVELFGSNRNLRRGWLTIGHPDTLGPEAPGWEQAVRKENAGSIGTHSSREFDGGSQAEVAGSRFHAPEEYNKARFTSYFQVDPVGCPLSERRNVLPFDESVEMLRPRTPPSGSGGESGRNNDRNAGPEGSGNIAAPAVGAGITYINSGLATLGLQAAGTSTMSDGASVGSVALPRGLGSSQYSQQQPRTQRGDSSQQANRVNRTTRLQGPGSNASASSPSQSLQPSPQSSRRQSVNSTGFSRNIDLLSPAAGAAATTTAVTGLANHPGARNNAYPQAGRAFTTGLGAGGPVTVSVQSGSETLSGPQQSAIGLGLGMGASPSSQARSRSYNNTDVARGDGGGGRGRRQQGRGGEGAGRGRGGGPRANYTSNRQRAPAESDRDHSPQQRRDGEPIEQ